MLDASAHARTHDSQTKGHGHVLQVFCVFSKHLFATHRLLDALHWVNQTLEVVAFLRGHQALRAHDIDDRRAVRPNLVKHDAVELGWAEIIQASRFLKSVVVQRRFKAFYCFWAALRCKFGHVLHALNRRFAGNHIRQGTNRVAFVL